MIDALIDWLDNLQQYTYDLSDSVAELFDEINSVMESIKLFMEMGKYYIIGSGIMLAVILLVVIVNQIKINKLQKKIDILIEDRGIRQNE